MSLKRENSYLLFRIILIILISVVGGSAYSQTDSLLLNARDTLLIPVSVNDSTLKGVLIVTKPISLNVSQSLEILKKYYDANKDKPGIDEELQKAIERLILYVENGPIDTTVAFLEKYPFKELIPGVQPPVIVQDTLALMDSTRLSLDKTDSLALIVVSDSLLNLKGNLLIETSPEDSVQVDSLYLKAFQKDSVMPGIEKLPINQYVNDSLRSALSTMFDYVQEDSTSVWLHNIAGDSTQIIIRRDSLEIKRFWLKNTVLDSVGIWVQAYGDGKLKFFIDDDYSIRFRKSKKKVNFNFEKLSVDKSLKKIQLIKIEPNPWSFDGIGELTISQIYLKNWTKGGENSLSTLFRGIVNADYKKGIYIWDNYFRLKLGFIALSSEGIRKNTDTWEASSNFGIKASKKWYYSFSFNLKSQLARGYNYPDVTTVISSFMSPGNLYSSLGFEFKPKKTTSVLFSPLTYKAVFVIDTANVDQTQYGVAEGKMAKNEIGLYLKSRHIYKFTDDIILENRLHFFTDYKGFDKIDLDWEALLVVKLGPFFSFSFSTHLKYDTDVTFPVYDDAGNETGRKAKIQFKEWLGFGVRYRF